MTKSGTFVGVGVGKEMVSFAVNSSNELDGDTEAAIVADRADENESNDEELTVSTEDRQL